MRLRKRAHGPSPSCGRWTRNGHVRPRSCTATSSLASALGSFCGVDEGLDGAASGRSVDAYRAAGGTAAPHDDDLLVPLLRVKRILEILRAPTDREPRWEHQRRNLRSLANLAT
jgi:hypothetical protein